MMKKKIETNPTWCICDVLTFFLLSTLPFFLRISHATAKICTRIFSLFIPSYDNYDAGMIISFCCIESRNAWKHYLLDKQYNCKDNAIWLLFALNPMAYTIQIIDLSRGLRHAVIAFSKIARVIFSHCRNNISFPSLYILRERERLGKWDFWCKTIKEIIVSIVSHIIIAKNCSDGEKTLIYFFKKFAVVI